MLHYRRVKFKNNLLSLFSPENLIKILMSTNKKSCSILKLVLVFTHCHDKQKYALFFNKILTQSQDRYNQCVSWTLCTGTLYSYRRKPWRQWLATASWRPHGPSITLWRKDISRMLSRNCGEGICSCAPQ